MVLDKYDNETYLKPYWCEDTIYHEAVTFIKKNEEYAVASLLFEPTEIISLRSSTLEQEYILGKDYTVNGKEIIVTKDSKIPTIDYDELFCNEKSFPSKTSDKHYKYIGNADIILKQVAITYKHSGKWNGYVPTFSGKLLPRTCKKLKNGEKLHITFIGDSITVTGDTSGMSHVAPFMPRYPEMTAQALKRITDCDITFDNFAIAGTSSVNFFNNKDLSGKASDSSPDLLIIAYGMNDSIDADDFKDNIKNIYLTVREKNPDCECIAVSTLVPNRDACWEGGAPIYKYQDKYESALLSLEETGFAVAHMTSIYKYLEENKGFYSLTGNGINHPNDFVVRAYAQTLVTMLAE